MSDGRQRQAVSAPGSASAVVMVALACAAVLATMTLVGWLAHVPRLRAPVALSGDMKFNAALCILALAGAAAALAFRPHRARPIVIVLAGFALAMGLATASAYVFGWDLGLDELFVDDTNSSALHPGRMAPVAAALIAVLALALLLQLGGHGRLTEALAVVAALTALVIILGYAYAVIRPPDPNRITPIALHTSVALLAMAIAAIRLADRRVAALFTDSSPGNIVGRRILTLGVVGVPLLGWLRIRGADAGLFSPDTGTALLVVAFVAVLGAVVAWTAGSVDAAARRMRADAERHAVLLRTVGEGIYGIDRAGRATFVNDAALRMLGYESADQLLGRSMHELIHHSRRDGTPFPVEECPIYATLATGSAEARSNDFYWRADGSGFPLAYTATPLVGDDGAPEGTVVAFRDISPELRAQEELRAAAQRMQTLFEASPVPTVITRAGSGEIIFVNKASVDLLGWSREQMVGATIEEVGYSAGSAALHSGAVREALDRDGVVHDLEQELVTSDGRRKTVLASFSLVRLDGEPSIVVMYHDVSERRELEARLEQSERRYRDLFEQAATGIAHATVDGVPIEVNHAWARLLGYDSPAQFLEEVRDTRVLYANPAEREALTAQLVARGSLTGHELRLRRRDGSTIWIALDARLITDETGAVVGFQVSGVDISARRAAEEAVRESERRFRLLAENSTDVISRATPDGSILYVSPACRTVYGWEPDELTGRNGWELVHPDDRDRIRTRGSARDGDAWTDVYRVRRKDGSYVWMEVQARSLRDPGTGAVTEVQTSARDITQRRGAEEAAANAQAEAERANAAKTEFLSRVSHELRTPLHAILGFGDLLEHEGLNDRQQEKLRLILRSGRHLLELINDVLDITRIEGGNLGISVEPVRVVAVIRDAVEMIRPLAMARSITLQEDRGGCEGVYVLTDQQRTKQVLLNLLSNAVKYNDRDGTIEVRCEQRASGTLRIAVTDTGRGIAPENLARVFEPFERLGAEATDVEGTGLGLTLSKRLVEAMGGTIGVESQPDQGSTFWVEFSVVGPPEARRASEADRPTLPERVRGPARTVLLVEDNPSNIKLVEAILAARPEVELLVATQGGIGIDLAREHRPSLVLLDLNLPDISGAEVLERLRADERTARIPIVLVSADATPRQAERLLAAGADGYLTKPFGLDEFLAVVDGKRGLPEAGRQARAGAATAAALDPETLAALRKLGENPSVGVSAVRDLVELFLTDAGARIVTLAAAARDGDVETVQREGHALRGASGGVGARRLAQVCRALEVAAQQNDLEGMRSAVEQLDPALEEARSALRAELGLAVVGPDGAS